ncbi:L-aminopeptidase/D-esterase [Aspergillus sclerotioniger CBS 115572]|uniref:L-aminopeptidase/D-esterase n=1 Tax=Aspergillus sclerotioniger CBS 115572 TaxID=1450535 RepID=A0A317XEB5_9EURO|nr:L-aminopeptidase/D-esterase [Aspergillus sclerotioniger CBS 115572]PWY96112.1 L-aminopeptidase/D-esterase [Aspergillus sclerotioniger CBS 115572]
MLVQLSDGQEPPRMRIRQLLPGLDLGTYSPGPLNSITDVPGVMVHTQEIFGSGGVNTGATSIIPRADWATSACYAGIFRFNASGELTGAHNLQESGLLSSPIVLTGTYGIGAAHQGIHQYAAKAEGDGVDGQPSPRWLVLPVVGETLDAYLHNCTSFAVKPEHIVHGLENVRSGEAVREGNVGGGVGMICHGLKEGTGSSSRRVLGAYTVAALVQANYGILRHLRIAGVPVARPYTRTSREPKLKKDGSIIVILATDAPLHPSQLQRIAKRATVGLARVGGQGHTQSGDIFLAFSTGNRIPVNQSENDPRPVTRTIEVMDDSPLNDLFEATADVVEEAIYNALRMAETLVGHQGHTVEAMPLDRVKQIMRQYRRASGDLGCGYLAGGTSLSPRGVLPSMYWRYEAKVYTHGLLNSSGPVGN